MDLSKKITFKYKNWKGETAVRNVIPERIFWGKTEWHSKELWLLEAFDIDKNVKRSFAIEDIVEFNPKNPS